MGAKLGEGMWSTDFEPRVSTNLRLTEWRGIPFLWRDSGQLKKESLQLKKVQKKFPEILSKINSKKKNTMEPLKVAHDTVQ